MEIHFNGFISQSLAHYNNYIVYNDGIYNTQSYALYIFKKRTVRRKNEKEKKNI